ncbi:MAG: PilZ domain-containing protein [Proteobacteria bacterium]|nr:PilZ domain-containing protein [Pseudomonadota bacterium]
MANKDERRKYLRVKSEFDIKINRISSEDTVIDSKRNSGPQVGKSLNISGCGVLVKYHKPFEMDSIIQVSFIEPNTFDVFKGQAKVVRVEKEPSGEGYEIGVEFLNLSEEHQNRIDYYITSDRRDSYS